MMDARAGAAAGAANGENRGDRFGVDELLAFEVGLQ